MKFDYNIDTRQAKFALRLLGEDALPEAVADTLNRAANLVMIDAKRNLARRHTLRNKFSERSIRTSPSRPKRNIASMYARVYSISPYLHVSDRGGTLDNEGKAIPIPMEAARVSYSHQKAKRRVYRMRNLAPEISKANGDAFILGQGSTLREPGIFTRQRGRLRMLYNLGQKQLRIRGSQWWSDALRFREPATLQRLFNREVERTMRRRLSGKFRGA